MSRIAGRFNELRARGRKGLIAYVCAGDPSRASTVPVLRALARAGADVIEVGVPFSDPMADGPVIQRAAERAIRNGVGLKDTIAMVAEFRKSDTVTPVVLMGYANPIERMGRAEFARAAQAAGVDGVIVVDYPPEEAVESSAQLKAVGIDPIFLLTPTTTDARIAAIAAQAAGFLYYVSLKGITGAGHLDVAAVASRLPVIRRYTSLPVAVGFGVRDAAKAQAVAQVADAVVIGSRIIEEMEAVSNERAVQAAERFVSGIRTAIDNAPVVRVA